MALYETVKALIQDNLPDNVLELITPELHRDVEDAIVDYVGAAQVYVNPAVTDNPGAIENPRAYIALPGTYTHFGGVVVTAPLGIISWNGTAWSVTQLPIPSPSNYFRAKTTAALSAGSPYTSISISQSAGGYTAKAGTWVKLVNRRTGVADFVQLKADMDDNDTSISIVTRTLVQSFPVDSIVEVFPTIGMRYWHWIPVAGAGVNFVDMPTTWRPPPVECVEGVIWAEHVEILLNNTLRCLWNATPTEDFHFNLHATNRYRVEFANDLPEGTIVAIKVYQPAILEVAS